MAICNSSSYCSNIKLFLPILQTSETSIKYLKTLNKKRWKKNGQIEGKKPTPKSAESLEMSEP